METQKRTEDEYTFELSDQVERRKVRFKNRYGITLAGDYYSPKDSGGDNMPALVIGGPYGSVKEQVSGLYANQMAQRGYAVLTFDQSFTGESEGEPRNTASPEIYTEDFSAAVDFLGLQSDVDRNKIGAIGVCGSGGFVLNAAAVDKRIKAATAIVMYDISRMYAKGYFDSTTAEQRSQQLDQMSMQRWEDAKNGTSALAPGGLPDEITGNEPEFVQGYFNYYKTNRGFHPRSVNSNSSWTITTPQAFMNMPMLSYVEEVSPRPVLIIAGEKAHSRYFSETAFEAAQQPKELLVIPDAVHTDLYDNLDLIPFDKIEEFFQVNLK